MRHWNQEMHWHGEIILLKAKQILSKRKRKQSGHILNIRKRQRKIRGQIMKKKGLENLALTWHVEGKSKRASNLPVKPVWMDGDDR